MVLERRSMSITSKVYDTGLESVSLRTMRVLYVLRSIQRFTGGVQPQRPDNRDWMVPVICSRYHQKPAKVTITWIGICDTREEEKGRYRDKRDITKVQLFVLRSRLS